MPNSKSKLHRTCKFCCTYELQYTHHFFQAKTASGFGYEMISNFSNPHFFVMLEYGATDFRMCYFNVGVTLFKF